MATEGYKRRISAILSVDVVGYSRLMEDDEYATVGTLESYRETVSTAMRTNCRGCPGWQCQKEQA